MATPIKPQEKYTSYLKRFTKHRIADFEYIFFSLILLEI